MKDNLKMDSESDSKIELKFQISLQKFSAVTIAARLWDHEEIKKRVRKYFDKAWDNHRDYLQDPRWQTIVKKVFSFSTLLNLCEKLLTLVQDAIIPVGEEIYYWNMHLLRMLLVDTKYAFKIYWTSLGTIDVDKCFHNHWVKIANNSQGNGKMSYNSKIFYLACLFIQENFLQANFKELKADLQCVLASFRNLIEKCKLHDIIILWLCVHFKKAEAEAIEFYKNLKKSDNMDKELLLECIDDGLLEATKFFWKRLNQADKQTVLIRAAECALRGNFMKASQGDDYSEEKKIEIIIFLMNNMTDKQKYDFCNENFVPLMGLLTKSLPYQALAENVFNACYWDHSRLTRDSIYILEHFLDLITERVSFYRYADKDICRRIFMKAYECETRHFKLPIIIYTDVYVVGLYQKFDTLILSMILNDRDWIKYREKLLNLGNSKYKELVHTKKFDLLNEFVNSVFESETEQKNFRLRISCLPEILSERKYELADEVLNWLACGSIEERGLIKQQIDFRKICCLFKNFKCEQVDELLLWQFDKEEERKMAKEKMKESDFICDNIVEIWNKNYENPENKCAAFLTWLADSKEETIVLKNYLVIGKRIIKKFCETLPSWKDFQRINQLLEFFSLTPANVLKIKNSIIENIGEWVDYVVLIQKNFKIAEALIGWIFPNRSKKKEVMKNYMNSLKGAELLFKVFKECKYDKVQPLPLLLNSWVKLYGDVNVISQKLEEIGSRDYRNERLIWELRSLLNYASKLTIRINVSSIKAFIPYQVDSDDSLTKMSF